MKTRLLKILITIFLPSSLLAQKIDNLVSYRDMESNRYFRFNYENDLYASQDENYTQGYNLEFAHDGLKGNPINKLFFKFSNSTLKYGLSFEHIGYTPNDYVATKIQFGDRPFASAMLLKSFQVATDTTRKTRISQTFSFGFIGQMTLGKEMQVEIHKIVDSKIPKGWGNQIRNDVVLNYRLDFEKQIFQVGRLLNLQSSSSMQLGTLFSHISTGMNATIGFTDSPFSSNQSRRRWRIYFYSQPIFSIIAYDATLQGGLLNKNSPYTISSKDIERFTAQINYGLILKTRCLYFEIFRVGITKEFETGDSAKWGGFKFGFKV